MPPRKIDLQHPRDVTAALYTDACWEVQVHDDAIHHGMGSVLADKNTGVHAQWGLSLIHI
eukprot:12005299-Karenia_brevis.AAC.1